MKESFYKKLTFAALASALVIFAGCFNKNSSTIKAEIDFWDFPNFSSESGVAGDFEKNLIAAFEKEYPTIKVNFKLISFAEGPAEIEAAIADGKAPDIVYDAPGRIIIWAERGLLEPLDDVLATEKPYITTGLLSVSAGKDRRTYCILCMKAHSQWHSTKKCLKTWDLSIYCHITDATAVGVLMNTKNF